MIKNCYKIVWQDGTETVATCDHLKDELRTATQLIKVMYHVEVDEPENRYTVSMRGKEYCVIVYTNAWPHGYVYGRYRTKRLANKVAHGLRKADDNGVLELL